MIPQEQLVELRDLLGSDGVTEHAPIEQDGQEISVTLRPGDGEMLAGSLTTLGRLGLGAVVRGGGNRLDVGNAPRKRAVILSTERLAGIDAFEPSEGVCRVRAGTTLAELRARVNSEGWDVPLDPPGLSATVGGVLAAAAVGPRAHGDGLPRDAVLGLDVAFATGERTRCGGRVVKNVTGYDLAKLYTGSFGSLAVIEAAWLRLRSLPESVRHLEARLPGGATASALAAARRISTRAACLTGGGADGSGAQRLVVELAGPAPSVDRDADWLAAELAAAEAPADAIDGLREHQGAFPGPGGIRFRIAALPSRFDPLLAALHDDGAETLCYPGLGLVYAGFRLPEAGAEAAAERVFRGVAAAATRAEACSVCETAPAWAKTGREMHGEATALLPLFAALKTQFDPENVLNPGRFSGGL